MVLVQCLGSNHYGGQEIPPAPRWRPKKLVVYFSLSPRAWESGVLMPDGKTRWCLTSSKKSKFTLPSSSCSSNPQRIGGYPTCTGEDELHLVPHSNAMLCGKHLHRHTQKLCFTSYMGRLPRWLNDKESTWQCRRCRRLGFNAWVTKILWRRKSQSTPIFLPGKSHGQRILVGYNPWGQKESDMTEHARTHPSGHPLA